MYNFDDVMSRLDDIESKIDTLIERKNKTESFQVVATDGKQKQPIADYLFDKMQDAILFYREMNEEGYSVQLNRKWI